jgi:hypothetical protein
MIQRNILITATVLFFFLAVSFLQAQHANGGVAEEWNYIVEPEQNSPVVSFFTELLTPQFILDTKEVRAYVRDRRFNMLRKKYGDTAATNAIFVRALKVAEYNIQRALWLSLSSSLDHAEIIVRLPIIGSFTLPLSLESDSLFQLRMKHLPRTLYPDSPKDAAGDIDKLQHFFGSAYLAFMSESPGFTNLIGNTIEWGEAQVVVGGTNDDRDRRANKQGERFGKALLGDRNALPSDFIGAAE